MVSTSSAPRHAFVWAWLPGSAEPVLAGQVRQRRAPAGRSVTTTTSYEFAYSQTYLARPDAISLFLPEVPLKNGWIDPPDGMSMAGCLRDGSPDSWGQRVIIDRLTGKRGQDADAVLLDELTYLLESGSNRIGGLDFQASSSTYVPRMKTATLDELHQAANALQAGTMTPELAAALADGTAVGGARPKVLVTHGTTEYIAKLSTSTDRYPVVKAEAAGLALARQVGIPVPDFEVTRSLDRDVLLVERFDRPGAGERLMVLSALTILGFSDFLGARWSSYPEFLDALRKYGPSGEGLGKAVYERIVLNILIGNTDDHARNHAAFWDGECLQITPAYDLCPQLRAGSEASQAMDIGRAPNPATQGDRRSNRSACVAAAREYSLSPHEAAAIFDAQVETIRASWSEVADDARLTRREAEALLGRQILNPYALT
jgi:serine/threonine-protein kinase HipA